MFHDPRDAGAYWLREGLLLKIIWVLLLYSKNLGVDKVLGGGLSPVLYLFWNGALAVTLDIMLNLALLAAVNTWQKDYGAMGTKTLWCQNTSRFGKAPKILQPMALAAYSLPAK